MKRPPSRAGEPVLRRSRGWLRKTLLALLAATLLVVGAGAFVLYRMARRPPLLSEAARCRLGAYALPDGEVVAVRQREGEQLRVVSFSGWTHGLAPGSGAGTYASLEEGAAGAAPALAAEFDCGRGELRLRRDGGEPVVARKLPLSSRESRFVNADVELAGRLVLPAGDDAVPIVVLVHGSERDSALDGNEWQFFLPAHSVGAFVYDKRGTGRSGGDYTQDFDQLAADAIAAAAEAHRFAGGRAASIGYLGSSQGGWVAPLAAHRSPSGADFVAVLYGLAESPLAEDREEVMLGLRRAGFDDDATLAKARELPDATGRVMASDFRAGFDELAAIEAKFRDEPWLKEVEGEFSGQFLRLPLWALRLVGPRLDVGTSWEYDPLPTLEAISTPHLWVLAGSDREAPSARTLALLRDIQTRRPNLDVARFPDADHGIWVERRDASGKTYSGYAPGYRELVVRWIATHSLAGAAAGIETWEGSERDSTSDAP